MRMISPLADRPGTFPCFVMKFCARSIRAKAASISTPLSARAAIRARCSRSRRRACSRSTATPRRSPLAPRSRGARRAGSISSKRAFPARRGRAGDWGSPISTRVVLDIGVSSMQLDEAARGFSFRGDGPLDMRMERPRAPAPPIIVNTADEATLADILYLFRRGAGRAPHRARHRRRSRQRAFRDDGRARRDDRARGAGATRARLHPATRSFQALRIAVNDELGELVPALGAAEAILKPGGRLAVVTFHSLEDRIVKQFFAARSGRGADGVAAAAGRSRRRRRRPSFCPASSRLLPSEAEIAANPRARSAKLRYGGAATRGAAGVLERQPIGVGAPAAA